MRIAGLVLAAGAGTRIGRPKALLALSGRRFVDLAIDVLRAGGADPVFVVVGAVDVGHVDAIVVVNRGWTDGLGSSLAAGLAATTSYDQGVASLDGVVVSLVDQPRISPDAVRRVLDAARSGAPAAVATYHRQPLHPVYLQAAAWPAVTEQAGGERGARAYLTANADRIAFVACDGLGDPADVDTADDLARLQ